jgi:5S rRNA maturation endonuclease (ribonuclease M5)
MLEEEELLGNIFQVDESECIHISIEEVLQLIDEESIFKLIFGFKPIEGEKVISPFREDKKPNCWFETDPNGRLRFIDFGNPETINGIKMFNIDCFHAVQIYYGIETFQKTLHFIKKLATENTKAPVKRDKKVILHEKRETKISFKPRAFNQHDKKFWKEFGISKKNLIEDKVFAVECFKTEKELTDSFIVYPYDICYIYTDFKNLHKKIYRPKHLKNKFLTNCNKNDIGSVNQLKYVSSSLYITKSYKDCRVLRNIGLESIWLQNEGMFPDYDTLYPIVKNYKKVYVFFDNDYTGETASKALNEKLTAWNINSQSLKLPYKNIKDPSDLVKYYNSNYNNLIKFIKNE